MVMQLEERMIVFILLFLWGMLAYPLVELLLLAGFGDRPVVIELEEVVAAVSAVLVVGLLLRRYYKPGGSFLVFGFLFGFLLSLGLSVVTQSQPTGGTLHFPFSGEPRAEIRLR